MVVMEATEVRPDDGLIRLKAVLEILKISKSTLYSLIKAGRFPPPIHISPRTSAWRRADIIAIIEKEAAR